MNQENKKLGRGLGSLLSSGSDSLGNKEFKKINITEIKANHNQPRKNFKTQDLEELSDSIKSQGILQPIVVRTSDTGGYEIIAGERRWRAAQIAGLHQIPALIKDMTSEEVQEAALIENIQRENLNAVEEAVAYKSILSKKGMDYSQLSKSVGKSKSHISNMMRLLELDQEILDFVISGDLSMGHARALIGVPNAKELATNIINKKLSVRDVEKTTAKYKKQKPSRSRDPNIIDLEKELSEKIGLKTSINFNEQGSSGSITLYYSDLDQLDDIMKRLKRVVI
jgi:ParB family chromosome partitioning protein